MAREYTIGRLAKTVGLSRSTLLYYDRLGLLSPVNRTEGNYRLYAADEVERLRRICAYREMGIPLKQIGELIDRRGPGDSGTECMLEKHLESLDREIESLRKQQRQVVLLLEQITSRTSPGGSGKKRSQRPRRQSKGPKKPEVTLENDMITKDRWVEIMRAAGLSDDDMHNWHRQFEKLEPDAHQEFLESLGIEADEIDQIRERFKS
jgi:DNA-binding transcriptional MerR regulator